MYQFEKNVNSFYIFINSKFDQVLSLLFRYYRHLTILCLGLVLSIVFWSVDKGFVFSDEAFYIFYSQQDLYKFDISNWYRFSNYFFDNILYNRVVMIILMITSSFFLGFSFSAYKKLVYPNIYVGFWAVIAQFILYTPISFSPNYINFGVVVGNFIFCFLFYFLSKKRKAYLLVLGMLIGFLFFIQITSTISSVIILILLYLNQKDLKQLIYNSLFITLGAVLFMSFYFFFIEGIVEFIEEVKKVIEYVNFEKRRDTSALLKWMYTTLKHGWVIIALLLFEVVKNRLEISKLLISVVYFIFLCLSIYLLKISIWNEFRIFMTQIFYIILVYMAFNTSLKNRNDVFGNILFAFSPLLLCFGTDVWYFLRSAFYFPFIFLPIIFFLKNSTPVSKFLFVFLALICIINFSTLPFRQSWGGYELIEQKVKYDIGDREYLKLDEAQISKLEELRPYIEKKENVIHLSTDVLGYIYLLEAKPLLLYFRPNGYINKYIKENNIDLSSLLLLESKERESNQRYISQVIEFDEYVLDKKELNNFNIYFFKKNR